MIKPSNISQLLYNDFKTIIDNLYPLVIKDAQIKETFGTYEIANYQFVSSKDGIYDDEITATCILKVSTKSYKDMQNIADNIIEKVNNDSKYESVSYNEDFDLTLGLYISTFMIKISVNI